MTLRDQIVQQAMTLPPQDREYVVDLLERSLSNLEFRPDEISEAWSQEVKRRLAAYDRGESAATDFEITLNRLHQALEARHAHKATP